MRTITKGVLFSFCGLLVLSGCETAGAVKVPGIAPVQTYGDLMLQPGIDAGGGVIVHLGIQSLECPRYGGVLLYCLTDRLDPASIQPVRRPQVRFPQGDAPSFHFQSAEPVDANPGSRVGPLQVECLANGRRMPTDYEWSAPLEIEPSGPCRLLYTKGIVLDQPGGLRVTVRNADGREVASCTLRCSDRDALPWSTWERESFVFQGPDYGTPPLDIPKGFGVGFTERMVLHASGVPHWPGCRPTVAEGCVSYTGLVFDPSAFGQWTDAKVKTVVALHGLARLPGFMPSEPDPGFRLSFLDDWLCIDLDSPFGACGPAAIFLARFWLNGKQIPRPLGVPTTLPDGEAEIQLRHTGWHPTRKLAVPMRKNIFRQLDAKPGDKVGVQLLLCRAGLEELQQGNRQRSVSFIPPEVPLVPDDPQLVRLSNRVELTVP